MKKREALIPISSSIALHGTLTFPSKKKAIVIFAHGSGSSRFSPRNIYVSKVLQDHGFGTLLFDLLSEEEDSVYENRFDIDLITSRLIDTTGWLTKQEEWKGCSLGYFGASTGSAAALRAAAILGDRIDAVVSRGGRPDMTGPDISKVKAPTLLIVGGVDQGVIELNGQAYAQLRCEKKLEIVPGATHLFEEAGALEQVAKLAAHWFERYLK